MFSIFSKKYKKIATEARTSPRSPTSGFSRSRTSSRNSCLGAGFTLIEMLTVIAIFTVVTSIILFNLPSFQGATNLELVAQEIALHIRGAQLYSTATRSSGLLADPNARFASYGIHFNLSNKTQFGLYPYEVVNSNPPEDTDYQKGLLVAETETYSLPRGYEISRICVGDTTPTSCNVSPLPVGCYNTGAGVTQALDISFARPNPEPRMCTYGPAAVCNNTPVGDSAFICVKVSRVNNIYRMIEVNAGGQIAIKSLAS